MQQAVPNQIDPSYIVCVRPFVQSTPGVKSAPFMVPNPQLLRNLAHPLQNDPVYTMLRVSHGLTQLVPVPPLQVLISALSRSFCLKNKTKY